MKIRQGFVSNSSSSSFIIIAPSSYNYLDNIEDEDLRELYKNTIREKQHTFNKEKVKVYEGWADTSCGENTIYDTSAFNTYCEKKNIDENDACEVAENLYFNFDEYFDDTCLKLTRGD